MGRILWLIRTAGREAHAEMGSIWLALWTTLLIGLIPIAAISGFHWNPGTKAVLVAAVISYPITFVSVMGRKAWDIQRHGHPHLASHVDVVDGALNVWLSLKDGSPPQGVHELGVTVVHARGVRLGGVWGSRTIDRTGPMPPHVTYPDDLKTRKLPNV